jgi:acyl carrier protein
MDETAFRCIQLVAQSKGLPPDRIALDSTLEDLGIDSLDKVNLSFALEEAFEIAIPDDSLYQLRTVGDIVRGVERLRIARHEPAGS